MKFNLEFKIRGAGGEIWAPNTSNPIECESLMEVLDELKDKIPVGGLVEVIGVKVEIVEDKNMVHRSYELIDDGFINDYVEDLREIFSKR